MFKGFCGEYFELVLACAILLLIIALVFLIPVAEKKGCAKNALKMGFDYEWSAFGGCLIEYEEGKWIPLSNYTVIEREEAGK